MVIMEEAPHEAAIAVGICAVDVPGDNMDVLHGSVGDPWNGQVAKSAEGISHLDGGDGPPGHRELRDFDGRERRGLERGAGRLGEHHMKEMS